MSRPSRERPLRLKIFLLFVAGFFLIAVVAAAVGGFYWLQAEAPSRVTKMLGERFEQVELESLDLLPLFTPLPSLTASGKGLQVSPKKRPGVPPLITMTEFTVELGFLDLLRSPIRIEKLHLNELIIQITPRREGEERDSPASKEGPQAPPEFLIENLVADGAILRIFPKNPEKSPLQFDLNQLRLQAAGPASPMHFESILQNARPPGEIQTRGTFGPFNLSDPGKTPVEGEYTFADADLSVFGGIGGSLYSEGVFGGVLERLEVRGYTATPDFTLETVSRPVSLQTEFNAIVDGTSGDTFLQPVEVRLADSSFVARGGVYEREKGAGKTIELDAHADRARVEHFLELAVGSDQPLMEGDILFDSTIVIPPGDADVVEELQLEGRFEITSARFLHPEIQAKVDELSALGRGERGDKKASRAEVQSSIVGEFALREGVMSLDRLMFSVPGSRIYLLGEYGLIDEKIDFRGELRTEAKISEMTSGVKSFLLKAVDPLFSRSDAGAVIPIKITGTISDVSFGVEKMRVLTRDEVASP